MQMMCILSQCDNDYLSSCNQNDHICYSSKASIELIQVKAQVSEEQQLKLSALDRKNPSMTASIFDECGIDKLPNEIMCDIILRVCLPAVINSMCKFNGDSPSSQGPLKLAKVSRRWRDLVFSIRKLWSAFSIQVNTLNMPLINLHLRLSGPTSPLSIRLFTKYGDVVKDDSVFNAVALINEHIHRITYLCLEGPKGFYSTLASRSRTIADAAPLLEELHIHKHGIALQSCSIDFKLCVNPPSPQRVHIDDYLPSKIHLDWQHVSQLHLRSSNLNTLDIVNVLSNAKSLVEFECDSTVQNQMTRLSTGVPIVLDSIQKVRIGSSAAGCQIFLNTTMCSMESLEIIHLSSPEWNLFPPFLQRSASRLTSLDLTFGVTVQPTGEHLINIFQDTPVLQALKLHFGSPCIGAARLLPFRKRFTIMPASQVFKPAGDPILLPHLQKLHLSGNLHIRYSPYLKIMESRHPTITLCGGGQVRALDELTIVVDLLEGSRQIAVTEDELKRILKLRKAGKTVMVSWDQEPLYKNVDLVEEAIASYKS